MSVAILLTAFALLIVIVFRAFFYVVIKDENS